MAPKQQVVPIARCRELAVALLSQEELDAALVLAEKPRSIFPSQMHHKDTMALAPEQLKTAYFAVQRQNQHSRSHKTPEQKVEERQLGWALYLKAPKNEVREAVDEMELVVGAGSKVVG